MPQRRPLGGVLAKHIVSVFRQQSDAIPLHHAQGNGLNRPLCCMTTGLFSMGREFGIITSLSQWNCVPNAAWITLGEKLRRSVLRLGVGVRVSPLNAGGIECVLHAEERVSRKSDQATHPHTDHKPRRRPVAKSVKIEGSGSESYPRRSDGRCSSETSIAIRRASTESATTANNRASTGSERTPAGPDRSPCSAPARVTNTTSPTTIQANSVPRQRAYRFDDEPALRQADMERAARDYVPHDTPARRHTVMSHRPISIDPKVQSVNTRPRRFGPPCGSPPAVQGVVVGVQDDSESGSAFLVELSSRRTFSLTHAKPPANHPQGPDFTLPRFSTKTYDPRAT